MTDQRRSWRPPWALIVLGLLYPLSTGPVVAIVEKSRISTSPFEILYIPLGFVVTAIGSADWINRYIDWWRALLG
jgi:hypothetical protein